jgi:hydrogenase maturation protein HypF
MSVQEEAGQQKATSLHRLRVEIAGAVQGVGFRPFIYRLATELSLAGWVINDTRGVFIEVEGERARLEQFLQRLPAEAPPNAHITRIVHDWLAPTGYSRFEIRHSDHAGARQVIILPDLATCPDCYAELFDPTNRRYRYPFTNCTNCGPRFTIVEALPYDRPNTTMRSFALCPACHQEYTDPLDRRFHAQPNACAACGPEAAFYWGEKEIGDWRLEIGDWRGGEGKKGGRGDLQISNLQSPSLPISNLHGDAALLAAVEAIRRGEIVAVKGLGGFHLVVDARNDAAVEKLRRRKQRPTKPLAVMVRSLEQAATLCTVTPAAADLLQSQAAPIVLLPRREDAPVADRVAPQNPDLGVMLPYTPLHHLLLAALDFPIVATSGNLTDEPICTDEWEAMVRLGEIADAFLVHNRPIARHADDSVLWIVDGAPQFLRRARGYAPLPVHVPQSLPTILGVGAHLKNTVALSIDAQVFLSQHIGDLETAPAYDAFQRVIADFLRLYEAQPIAIAHDLHPEYLSTKWAKERVETGRLGDWEIGSEGEMGRKGEGEKGNSSVETAPIFDLQSPVSQSTNPTISQSLFLIPVQHHHAHLAACLADNSVAGPALGLIWDGTGYGPDGTIWGGECLLGDAGDFTRVAHLRPFRLPGGEAAVREPRRVALALLWELYGDEAFTWEWLPCMRSFSERERRLLAAMLAKGVNAPVTTSMGRLFDGVAALIGLHQHVTFEGEAAMALEHCAAPSETAAYPFSVNEPPLLAPRPSPFLLDWKPLVEGILADLHRHEDAGVIAVRFHNALVEMGAAVAQRIGQPQVALSGGCFQNRRLTETMAQRLRDCGFSVLLHRQTPPNDGCISLGQVMAAARRMGIGD